MMPTQLFIPGGQFPEHLEAAVRLLGLKRTDVEVGPLGPGTLLGFTVKSEYTGWRLEGAGNGEKVWIKDNPATLRSAAP